jgi:hypothetical protein
LALLAMPDVRASTLFGADDLLTSPRRDWQMLMHGVECASPLPPNRVAVPFRLMARWSIGRSTQAMRNHAAPDAGLREAAPDRSWHALPRCGRCLRQV